METFHLVLGFALALLAVAEGSAVGAVPHLSKFRIARENITDDSDVGDDGQRIIGGDEVASVGVYPFMCSLWYAPTGSQYIYFTCGAILYNEKTVLTAAHCVDGDTASELYVICGDYKLNELSSEEQGSYVAKYKMHPRYEVPPGFASNDIAVMEMETPFTLNDNVNVAPPMPVRGDQFTRNCQLIGFGITESGGLSNTLRDVGIKRIGTKKCQTYWGASATGKNLCFINTRDRDDQPIDASSCNGDSGGPAVCGSFLVGVTSWGVSGCTLPYPSVYTKLQSYKAWIENNAY